MSSIPELFLPYYQQVGSAKSVEKDVKVLKSKLSDEGVVIKSLEAKLVELQSKGGHCLIRFQLLSYLRWSYSSI